MKHRSDKTLSNIQSCCREDLCPLAASDEYRGRPIPALPVHCVLESIERHGAESVSLNVSLYGSFEGLEAKIDCRLTRRYILGACGLSTLSHRPDVLSIKLLEKVRKPIEMFGAARLPQHLCEDGDN